MWLNFRTNIITFMYIILNFAISLTFRLTYIIGIHLVQVRDDGEEESFTSEETDHKRSNDLENFEQTS